MSAELPALRASDAERERAAEVLRGHMVEGRLSLDEFGHRVESVYAARTRGELDAVMHDLPAAPASVARDRRARAKRFTGVAFGSVERKGRWRVPRRAGLLAVFGDADVDLRTAEFEHRVVTITAILLFGNADFYVPAGFEVDLGGLTVFGHRREHGEELAPSPELPLIRIRVFSVFGTSDVWRIPPGLSGSFRELIRSVRGRKQIDAG